MNGLTHSIIMNRNKPPLLLQSPLPRRALLRCRGEQRGGPLAPEGNGRSQSRWTASSAAPRLRRLKDPLALQLLHTYTSGE